MVITIGGQPFTGGISQLLAAAKGKSTPSSAIIKPSDFTLTSEISPTFTKSLIEQAQIRQSTPTLTTIFPTITANFANIQENFKNIASAFQNLGQPATIIPNTTVTSPQPTQTDTTPKGDIQNTVEQIKSVLGPTGITLALVLGGLFVIKSFKN